MIFVNIVIALLFLIAINYVLSRIRFAPPRTEYDYDVIIVGGSIAGPVIAKALSDQNRRVLLLERSLFAKPDRIVGEVLQPGGINVLKELNMDECVAGIGVPCHGYIVHDENGRSVRLPFRDGFRGRSFHFGDFVINLRKYVWNRCKGNVTMLQATVNEVLVENIGCIVRAYGVEYSIDPHFKETDAPFTDSETPKPALPEQTVRRVAKAPLIIMCDGGTSKFKAKYQHYTPARQYHSHFIGLILRDVRLPIEENGTVFFGKTGPILSYRLDPRELRMLVDYKGHKIPSLEEQSKWLIEEVAPCIPEEMRAEFIRVSSDKKNIRSMPITRYFSTFPSIRGYVGIGDHANQRHPLTGGGMTCAFNDAFYLAKELASIKTMRSGDAAEMFKIEDRIQSAIVRYVHKRVLHSCCVNILSWALYAVFDVYALRNACLDYFRLGGDCVEGPMALLSALEFNPVRLLIHYCCVMANGMVNIITGGDGKPEATLSEKFLRFSTFLVDPVRIADVFHIFFASAMIAVPLVFHEFVSLWRLMDPTGFIPNVLRMIKIVLYRTFFSGGQLKPVGI